MNGAVYRTLHRRMAIIACWMVAWCLAACDPPAGRSAAPERGGLEAVLGSSGRIAQDGGDALDGRPFAVADRVIELQFPKDHGPHFDFRSEWWYLTAVLRDGDGRRFGVQFTLFRQGLVPCDADCDVGWRTGQIYMGHLALADVARRDHRSFERFSRHAALAGVRAHPFTVHIEGWQLTANEDLSHMQLTAAADDSAHNVRQGAIAVDLAITRTKPILLQGDRGLSAKGPRNASYYYSMPRMEAQGTVTVDGVHHAVRGGAWLDREWGSGVLDEAYSGWDWFGLQLTDGRDLMAFRLRGSHSGDDGKDGGDDFKGAVLFDAAGRATHVSARELRFEVLRFWRQWPVQWELMVAGERFVVSAAFDDQAMDTSIRYWEGVVDVGEENLKGSGYMELTGY